MYDGFSCKQKYDKISNPLRGGGKYRQFEGEKYTIGYNFRSLWNTESFSLMILQTLISLLPAICPAEKSMYGRNPGLPGTKEMWGCPFHRKCQNTLLAIAYSVREILIPLLHMWMNAYAIRTMEGTFRHEKLRNLKKQIIFRFYISIY